MRKAIAVLLFAAACAAAAPLPINTARYSITFAEGWATTPFFPATDSIAVVMKPESEASAVMVCDIARGPVDPDSILGSIDLAPEGLEEVSREERRIGPHTFVTAVYRAANPDEENADLRYRVYMTTDNGLFFMAFMSHPDGSAGTGVVIELEAALETLVLKGGSSIRPVVRGRSAPKPAAARLGWRDVLGRRPALSGGPVETPVFSRE